ncbi:MAG: hypothetical protein LC804_08200 [Acidobacteria bacterium]|nr:hypothetical protein [Acidobacteriota bacterium]
MVIKASAAGEIRALLAALTGTDDVKREVAIARFAVIGGRAVDRLITAYHAGGDGPARAAILRSLEPLADPRAAPVARAAMIEGGDMAVAGAGVLRGLLNSPHGQSAADALDTLMAAALDSTADRRIRLAALEALQDMPVGVRARVAEALKADPDTTVRAHAAAAQREAAVADALWSDAMAGRLPDDPGPLAEVIAAKAAASPLSALQKLIDAARARDTTGTPSRREGWRTVRGALHQAIARRGSRVALYDLRETLTEADGPLPLSFLRAIQTVGDASCLEPLASAFVRSPPANAWWRHQLAATFRAVAKRERISRRHAVMKRLSTRFPQAVPELMASS